MTRTAEAKWTPAPRPLCEVMGTSAALTGHLLCGGQGIFLLQLTNQAWFCLWKLSLKD